MIIRWFWALSIAAIFLMLPAKSFASVDASGASDSGASSAYVLAPDDQISINVLGHDEFHADVTILPDGTFDYPILGHVHAAGCTVAQLTQTITKGLSTQLNQPDVTITVSQSRPRKVSVLGAVRAPGLYDCKTGMRLLELIATCGGLAQDPAQTQATLVRDGGKESVDIDMPGLMGTADSSQNIMLDPGDVLLVEARDPSLAEVQVIGEVQRPGAYPVPTGGESLISLLTQAGGVTQNAAVGHGQIMHQGEVKPVDLRSVTTTLSPEATQVKLMPGDVLLVPTNNAKIAVMGEVRMPNTYSIPDDAGVLTSAALVEAGGVTSEADTKNADIVRRGPDGKPTLIPVDVMGLIQGSPSARDIMMQPGDVLYVPSKKRHGFNAAALLSIIPVVDLFYRP